MSFQTRILLFTGNGKGKTTAALGMALRACGHGMRVGILEFIKSQAETGEIASAQYLPHLDINQTGLGWIPHPNTPEYQQHQQAAQAGLAKAREWVTEDQYDLLILDEICIAISKGLIQEKDVLDVLSEASHDMVIVLTGRDAPEALRQRADTVTEMKCIKHGLNKGRGAQKGVEY